MPTSATRAQEPSNYRPRSDSEFIVAKSLKLVDKPPHRLPSRLPVFLRATASQLELLSDIREAQIRTGQGLTEQELAGHMKSINFMLFVEPVKLVKIGPRIEITEDGVKTLQAYKDHQEFKVLQDKAIFEQRRINANELEFEKATAIQALRQVKVSDKDPIPRMEEKLLGLVNLGLSYKSVSLLSDHYNVGKEDAIRELFLEQKSKMDNLLTRTRVSDIEVNKTDDDNHWRYNLVIHWYSLPDNILHKTNYIVHMEP